MQHKGGSRTNKGGVCVASLAPGGLLRSITRAVGDDVDAGVAPIVDTWSQRPRPRPGLTTRRVVEIYATGEILLRGDAAWRSTMLQLGGFPAALVVVLADGMIQHVLRARFDA